MSLTNRAFVPVTGPSLLDPFAAIGEHNGFGVDHRGDATVIDTSLGVARFDPGAQGTQLILNARTPAELQLLTDLFAQRLAGLSLSVEVAWTMSSGTTPPNQVLAAVMDVMPLSANFARVRLTGDFTAFTRSDAGWHFRLLFNPDQLGWPSCDANGVTQWPGGIESWHRPQRTVRRISMEETWKDVDIVLHEGGRITAWCDWIAPGDEVALHEPGGSKQPTAGWVRLLSDETALPVILEIIENASVDMRGQVLFAIRDAPDAQQVNSFCSFDIRLLDMIDDSALRHALNHLDLPDGDRHIFFAAERKQAAEARDWLRRRGVVGVHAKPAAYWTRTLN